MSNPPKTDKRPVDVIIQFIPEEEQTCELTVVIYTKPSAEQKAKLLKTRILANMV